MKSLIAVALATFALLPVASAAEQTIVVQSERQAQHAWVARISQDLSNNLRYPRYVNNRAVESGAVSIRFNCGLDGVPTDVAFVRKSGARATNLAAMRAVQKLRTLHPTPAGFLPRQPVRADIIFADSDDTARHLARQLKRYHEKMAARHQPAQTPDLVLRIAAEPVA